MRARRCSRTGASGASSSSPRPARGRLRAGNDSLYVATQWLSGPSLRVVLEQRRTLDATLVRRLAQQLASALDAAAAAGLVHLDIKPENVLFTSDGTEHAYVRDFGAGRFAARKAGLGRAGAGGGTLEYAAPEQIEGDAIDGRTLVYSLGCLLYEALTGVTPYGSRSSTALMPPPVGAGASVDHVFAIALAQRRDERYATCTDFADALAPRSQLCRCRVRLVALGAGVLSVCAGRPSSRSLPSSQLPSRRRLPGSRRAPPARRMRLRTSPSATARSLRRCRRPSRRPRLCTSRSARHRLSRESPRGRRRDPSPTASPRRRWRQ